jgi:hypothetical protein
MRVTLNNGGPAQHDLEALFARLDADPPGALDAVHERGKHAGAEGAAAGTR